jgi:hypothetical protein
MFRKSIRQKIVGIAAGLIVLAVVTSLLSMVMAAKVHAFRINPPDAAWDGAWHLDRK